MTGKEQSNCWDDAIDKHSAGRETTPPKGYLENQSFLERNPWPVFRAQLDQRYERHRMRKRLNWTLWFSGMGLAASLAVVLLVVSPRSSLQSYSLNPASDVRTKGATDSQPLVTGVKPKLTIETNGDAVVPGGVVSPGALLKFKVTTGDYDHVFVLGVEDDGRLTPYYPDNVDEVSLMVGRGRGVPLPDSVELDERLGVERYIAMFSNKPLNWSVIREAGARAWYDSGAEITAMGPLRVEGAEEASIWFVKRR